MFILHRWESPAQGPWSRSRSRHQLRAHRARVPGAGRATGGVAVAAARSCRWGSSGRRGRAAAAGSPPWTRARGRNQQRRYRGKPVWRDVSSAWTGTSGPA